MHSIPVLLISSVLRGRNSSTLSLRNSEKIEWLLSCSTNGLKKLVKSDTITLK